MVLNFNSTGEYGQAVYGNTSSQHVNSTTGAIAQSKPLAMQGGRSRRNRNQNGGRRSQRNKKQSRRQRNNSRRNQNGNRQRQRGGK